MGERATGEVKRRRVFYLPGYDPIPPRRYRELYRKEAAAQSIVSGHDISLAAKDGMRFGWRVEARIEGGQTTTDLDVLMWSDIVQSSMQAGIGRTYLILLRTAWTYIATGALFDLMKLRRGPVLAALYPVGVLLVQALIGLALWAVVARIGAHFGPWGQGAGVLFGAVAAYALLDWFKRQDGKFFAYYLMHDYGFSARWRGADPPELRARMDDFRADIAEALTEDWDEVLVVGHSSGAHLGVSILADLIRAGAVPASGPALSFLTLGHVIPMVAFLPDAQRLRADLAYLCTRPELTWVDVTAPGDPCCFALCDPIATLGLEVTAPRHPLLVSAAFTRTIAPARWAKLKRRFFRLHFQYLCAFDRPEVYDYFAVTAGPQTLAIRFADTAPSPSRITRAAARYRSVTP